MNHEVFELFPTPVMEINLGREFTEDEKQIVLEYEQFTSSNTHNKITDEKYVLENAAFSQLKQDLNRCVDIYFKSVIMPSQDCSIYITQSWLNFTETNQAHHSHSHPNSLVSGVLYMNADDEHDNITFYRDNGFLLDFEVIQRNRLNSDAWTIPVKTGRVLLFPSHLIHAVKIKEGTNQRVSLAFNTFVKGHLGNGQALTELFI